MKEMEISANDAGQRLDRFLKKYLRNVPLSGIYRMIRKDVKLNGKRPAAERFLCEGDVLSLYLPDSEIEKLIEKKRGSAGAKKNFTVEYEDDDILIVSKPYGLLVHGDATEKKNTLNNQVIDYLIEKGDYIPRIEKSFSPAPANRLDRNTTGLVVFGKNAAAQRMLTKAFAMRTESSSDSIHGVDAFSKQGHKTGPLPILSSDSSQENGEEVFPVVRKYYLALCQGKIEKELRLEAYLIKDTKENRVRLSRKEEPGSKFIKTKFRPLLANDRASLLEIELLTGRSHQIRAQLKEIKHPIIGDPKYNGRGRGRQEGHAQYLHAWRLVIDEKEIKSPLPPAFRNKTEELFGKDKADEIK